MLIWACVATFLLVGAFLCAVRDEEVIESLLMWIGWPLALVITLYDYLAAKYRFGVEWAAKSRDPDAFHLRSELRRRRLGPVYVEAYEWRDMHRGKRWADTGLPVDPHWQLNGTRTVGLGNPNGRHVLVYKTRTVFERWAEA